MAIEQVPTLDIKLTRQYLSYIGASNNTALQSLILRLLAENKIYWMPAQKKNTGLHVTVGCCTPLLNSDNKVEYKVKLPFDPENTSDIATFIEEFTHLIHSLLNPNINYLQTRALLLLKQLDEETVDETILELFAALNVDIFSKTHKKLNDMASALGFTLNIDPRTLLTDFFLSNRELVVVDLEALTLYAKWFQHNIPSSISELEIGYLEQLEEFRATQSREMRKARGDREKIDEIAMRPYPSHLQKAEKIVRSKILESISRSNNKQLNLIISELCLWGLDALAKYNLFYSKLELLDPEVISDFIISNIGIFSETEIAAIFYELRPTGYDHGFRLSTLDWLGVKSLEERKSLIIERMQDTHVITCDLIDALFKQNFVEEWAAGVGNAVLAGSPEFWDITEDNPSHNTEEYLASNLRAAQEYLDQYPVSTHVPILNSHFPGERQTAVEEHFSMKSILPESASALAPSQQYQAEWLSRTAQKDEMHSNYRGSSSLKLIAERLIEFGQKALKNNTSVSALEARIGKYLNLVNLFWQYKTDLELIMELVGKIIAMHYSGEDKIDIPSGDHLSYSLRLGARKENGELIWQPFFDAAVIYLRKHGTRGIIQMLQARSLTELVELVGLEP